MRRYIVLDALPPDVRRKFVKGLRAHCFMPLDPAQELDRSSGWVSILDGEDADLAPEKVFFVAAGGEQLRFTLRTDVLKAPPAEVRRQASLRAAEKESAEGRQLSRSEQRELKEEVARTLRLRAFPRVKLVDAVWDFTSGRIWFWSQSKAQNELFLDLFAKTFEARIEAEGPGRWARGLVDDKALAKLEPTPELWAGFAGLRPLGSAATEDDNEETV